MPKPKKPAKKHSPKTEPLTFRLPATVVTQLNGIAAIAGTDTSMVVRVLMAAALQQGRNAATSRKPMRGSQ